MRTFISRLIKCFILFVLISSSLLALFPTFVSTKWGSKQVMQWINHAIPGTLDIRTLDLNWSEGQTLEGIVLKDPQGQTVLSMEKLSTEATLWQLFRKNTQLGFTQIQDLNASIETDETGLTNLQQALGISNKVAYPFSSSEIVLSHVNAEIDLFAAHHPLSIWVKGLTLQDNLNGSFEIDLALEGLQASNWKELKRNAEKYLSIEGSKEALLHVQIVNFPVALIDRLVAIKKPHLNGLFSSIWGDRLNLTIEKEASGEGLAFHLTALAPLMQGEVKGKISNGLFILQEPATFQLHLTPEFVNPWINPQFELLNFSDLTLILPLFSCPLNILESPFIDPCLLGFKAKMTLPKTDLNVSSIGRVALQSLQLLVDAPICDRTLHLQVRGQAQQNKEPFEIHLDSILNKPQSLHSLSTSIRQQLQASVKLSQLTPELLQKMAALTPEMTQKLKAFFGESFTLQADCQLQALNGPLQASVKGEQGEIHLDGQIKQGILTLQQPLEGAVKMTPLLSQAFLTKNISFLSTAIGADNLITFKIDPTSFSVPLIPFQLEKVKMGQGVLELGKVHFRNEGELSSILNLIHSISDPYLTIWFTPLYFHLDQNVLTLDRIDMLVAHTYVLASWGTVHLPDYQTYLVLGLNGQTLQYAFGIPGLDTDYLLQIPLHGNNGKVEINQKKAMTRISTLLAQTQGGTTGKLLGTLMDLTSSKDQPTPPPTTQPFPWAEELTPHPSTPASSLSDSTEQDSEDLKGKKKKKHKKHESKEMLKELQQEAGQVIDQFFGS